MTKKTKQYAIIVLVLIALGIVAYFGLVRNTFFGGFTPFVPPSNCQENALSASVTFSGIIAGINAVSNGPLAHQGDSSYACNLAGTKCRIPTRRIHSFTSRARIQIPTSGTFMEAGRITFTPNSTLGSATPAVEQAFSRIAVLISSYAQPAYACSIPGPIAH